MGNSFSNQRANDTGDVDFEIVCLCRHGVDCLSFPLLV